MSFAFFSGCLEEWPLWSRDRNNTFIWWRASGQGSGSWTGFLFLGGARQPFHWSIQSLQPIVVPLLINYLQLHSPSVVHCSIAVTTWVRVAETMMMNAVACSRVVSCELWTLFLASAHFFVFSFSQHQRCTYSQFRTSCRLFLQFFLVLVHPNFSITFSISLIGKSTYLSKTALKTESPLFCAFKVVLYFF